MVFRSDSLSRCDDCKLSLMGTSESFDNHKDAEFIVHKSNGYRKFPSRDLFNLVYNHIETTIQKQLENDLVINDVVENIVQKIETLPSGNIGCHLDNHRLELVVKIIFFT